jgi:hypothetical protein
MFAYFFLLVAVLLALVVLATKFANADPKKLAKAMRIIGGGALMLVAALLTARGLFIYAIPLALAGYAIMQGRSPFPSSFPGSGTPSGGQQSRVRTTYIEMRLDHDSGDIEGQVIRGKFSGKWLSDLELKELLELWRECRRHDMQAAQLLEAYIDRKHPDWRELAGGADEQEQEGSSGRSAGGNGPMTVDEAYEILGLRPGAAAAEIRKAHRVLMKKLHPDQGGSNYLAAKINEAKDLLLKHG